MLGVTARKSALSLVDQVLVSGTSFLTTVVVGRFGGPEQLGIYSLCMTLLLLAVACHAALITLPYTVYAHRLQGAARAEYAGSVLVHHGGLTALTVLLLAATALAASLGLGPPGLAGALWVVAATAAFVLLRELGRRFAFTELRVGVALAIDAVVAAIQVAGLAWLLVAGEISAGGVYALAGVACAVAAVTWLALARRQFVVRRDLVAGQLRHNWSFARWAFAGSVTWMIHGYAMHWLLGCTLGVAETGILAACMTVVMLFNPLLVAVGNVMTPKAAEVYARERQAGVRRVVRKATVLLGGATAAYCCAIVLLGDNLMELLYHNPAYAGHGHLIAVLAAGLLVSVLSSAADSGLWVLERSDQSFKANLLGLAVTLLAAAPLLQAWGVVGAAYALLAGQAAASMVRGLAFLRASGSPVSVACGAAASAAIAGETPAAQWRAP
jgi:O-antigen/teichoic acid export membrane protein